MYKTDTYGEYRVTGTFVDAWPGGGPYVAGWCTCQVREYADGTTRVHREVPKYCHAVSPELAALHGVYLIAREGLK